MWDFSIIFTRLQFRAWPWAGLEGHRVNVTSPLLTTLPASFSLPPCSHLLPRNDASKVSHSSSQELTQLAQPRSSEPAKTTWRNLSLLGHITIALKISRTIYQTRTSLTTTTNSQFAFPKGRYRRSNICMRLMFSSPPQPHFYSMRPLLIPSRARVDPGEGTGVVGSVTSQSHFPFLSC